VNGSAQVVGEALDKVRSTYGGMLTPTVVVKAARPKRSALHSYFEWDDTKAAQQYRLGQAGDLIRVVVVAPEKDAEQQFVPVRAYHAHMDPERPAGTYHHIVDILSDEEKTRRLIGQAMDELQTWRRRHAALEHFAEIFTAIDSLVAA